MTRQTFRANSAVLIGDGSGNVLAFRRARHVTGSQPWQCPQGGIDVGEEPLDAALRELWEETGITRDQIEIVAEHPKWLAYEIPSELRGRDRGQTQKWFLVHVEPGFTPDLTKASDHEFDAATWMRPAELWKQVIEFKRPTYRAAIRYFKRHHQI